MSALDNLAPEQQQTVRGQVRALLERTESWKKLEPDDRRKVARSLVDVLAYLADPAAGQKGVAAEAMAQSGAEKVQDRLAKKPDVVGKDFVAGAAQAGTKAFSELVNAVDFPKFVSGLVEGVFTSIVDSSIRQMEAYGKLLEAVVKSVEEFANDNITANQGRDWLVSRYSDKLSIAVEEGNPRLQLNDDAPDGALAEIGKTLGVQGSVDLDDEASEAALVRKAQLEMARLRQKQLSTMVLLGINRIVVTDGLINAKVVFDVKSSDVASRKATASMYDRNDTTSVHKSGGGWGSDYDASVNQHRTVVSASSMDESESKLAVKANLTGEVRVNFKSETFNLNQMASAGEIETLNQRAKP
jgi:hypothetical protein